MITLIYFSDPAFIDVPVTQLLPYYPHLDVNPLVNLKGAGLAQPPLQLASHATQQISIPVYAPVYNQKQLISSVKQPYSTVEPVTFTTKVNLICVNATLPSKLYSCANGYVALIVSQYCDLMQCERETLSFLPA